MGKKLKFLIDSNIIIYHLQNNKVASEFITKNINDSAISLITFIEVLSYPFTKQQEKKVKELLNVFEIIEINCDIAERTIENFKIKKIKIPDNLILSTAQNYNLKLVTRNVKDFDSFKVKILNIFENKI